MPTDAEEDVALVVHVMPRSARRYPRPTGAFAKAIAEMEAAPHVRPLRYHPTPPADPTPGEIMPDNLPSFDASPEVLAAERDLGAIPVDLCPAEVREAVLRRARTAVACREAQEAAEAAHGRLVAAQAAYDAVAGVRAAAEAAAAESYASGLTVAGLPADLVDEATAAARQYVSDGMGHVGSAPTLAYSIERSTYVSFGPLVAKLAPPVLTALDAEAEPLVLALAERQQGLVQSARLWGESQGRADLFAWLAGAGGLVEAAAAYAAEAERVGVLVAAANASHPPWTDRPTSQYVTTESEALAAWRRNPETVMAELAV